MRYASRFRILTLLIGLAGSLYPQQSASWRDPSPHKVRFVKVDTSVTLEVLDWGGSGQSVVLLAGGGNTAHVFDEFAPKLTADCHIYGITRRGFGASSFSAAADGVDRLRDDVVAVLDALKLKKVVLVGHSIAGAELSSVATSHPDRIAGLIYLEAAYPYAFDNGKGATMKEFLSLSPPPPPTPREPDLTSFGTLQNWDARTFGFRLPEAEFRQTWESTADGRPTKPRDFPGSHVFMSIMTSDKKYTNIPVPALAVFAIPHVPENWMSKSTDAGVHAAATGYFSHIDALAERQANALRTGVPRARVVTLRGSHYVFLSNEADVIREMREFIDRLH